MLTYEDLIREIKHYSPNVNADLIKNSYLFALEQHGTQIRESGELYFSHPLAVAQILIDLKMDQVTIASGLLHDTVEDTPATVEQLKELFGSEVSKIVDGVTKLSKFEGTKIARQQTENYKKLLLSAASDIRVLIIKLADRLHNMRTLKYKKRKSRRTAIAKETIEIYAPLAERVGLQRIKGEMQDIAFYELYPELYKSIRDKLKNLYDSEDEVVNTINVKLTEKLNQLEFPYTINGRLKTPYSIWNKMNVRTISFEQLSDIMAFRIIVQTVQQCYQVLGLLHRQYLVVPGRFRDYISTPKSNGYQSLHTCVIGPLNKRIEIQIRTQEMHLMAEYGIAAHWEYKENKDNQHKHQHNIHSNYQWLKNMVRILDNTSKMDEFIEYSKTEISSENIFCITPKGEIIPLPIGSSVLDFAYAIHSEIGNHAIGAKVNNKDVPLKTIIENGDQISIITDKNTTPQSIWQTYVKTIKAKTEIRRALSSFEIDHTEIIGKNNFNNLLTYNHVVITEPDFRTLVKEMHCDTSKQFFIAIGSSAISMQEIVNKYVELFGQKLVLKVPQKFEQEVFNHIIGLPELPVLNTKCCTPIPGDKIIGIIHQDKYVSVHIEECEELKKILNNVDIQVLEPYWKLSNDLKKCDYSVRLIVSIINQPGNLSKIASIIESRQSSIVSLRIGELLENRQMSVVNGFEHEVSTLAEGNRGSNSTKTSASSEKRANDSLKIKYIGDSQRVSKLRQVVNFTDLYIECNVSSLSQLNMIMATLSATPFVLQVARK